MSLDIDNNTHLGLSYETLNQLENTGHVLRQLKERVDELGVVSDSVETYVIKDLGREHDVHIDFYSPSQSKLEGLERAKKEDHPPGTRYVFVGKGKRDEVIAEKAGWEYADFDGVAETEGWEVTDR